MDWRDSVRKQQQNIIELVEGGLDAEEQIQRTLDHRGPDEPYHLVTVPTVYLVLHSASSETSGL